MKPTFDCPDCESGMDGPVSRRRFVQTVGATAAAVTSASSFTPLYAKPKPQTAALTPPPETYVKKLYESLTDVQKKEVCFDWNHKDKRGLLRTHVSNNWHITKQTIASKFYTKDQQDLIEAIFFGLYNKDWRDRILQQIKDDAGGYGKHQNIAIFGKPGSGKFEFVMTGRHLTIRCDGDSTEHAAFGGPIFYGHAAQGFNEKKNHPGNVFWHQALKANALYKMLDGKQRTAALIDKAPAERNVHFKKKGTAIAGLPYAEMSSDQQRHLQGVLKSLLEPYRAADQKEAMDCLKAQGGLDKCRLSFYRNGPNGKSVDIGDDGVWDVWRLEGPAFVWYFRGAPHVHVWVNVASNADVKISTAG